MSTSRLRLLPWLVLAVTCSALLAASIGAGEASANNCSVNNTFQMGVINTCNTQTELDGSAQYQFTVKTTDDVALWAGASGASFGWGVFGRADATSGNGVRGFLSNKAPNSLAAGVFGASYSENQSGPGVFGEHSSSNGSAPGVLGHTYSAAANAAGVSGQINSAADYAAGVRGENLNANCCGFGVAGFSAGQGIGIGGYAPNGFGVFGFSPYNWAAWLDGAVTVTKDLHVNGTLYASAKNFRIDDPLDPAHRYLQHASVESNELSNVYSGNATTTGKGFATVTLPSWFQALNRDFRYQLTIVGARGWRARVVKEIAHDRFTIQTDLPRVKVSWQVTGVRHDPYANAHPLRVVVPKTGADAGKYAHPQLYGQPASKGVTALPAGLKYSKQAATAPKLKTK
jgi:hypothetical protein